MKEGDILEITYLDPQNPRRLDRELAEKFNVGDKIILTESVNYSAVSQLSTKTNKGNLHSHYDNVFVPREDNPTRGFKFEKAGTVDRVNHLVGDYWWIILIFGALFIIGILWFMTRGE